MYCSSLPFFPPVAEGLKFMLEVEDDEDWLQSDTTEDDEDSTRWAGQPFFFFFLIMWHVALFDQSMTLSVICQTSGSIYLKFLVL